MHEPLDLGAVFTVRLDMECDNTVYERDTIDERTDNIDDWEMFDGAVAGGTSLQFQVSTTNDDPASNSAKWSGWTQFFVGDFRARAFRLRVALMNPTPSSAGTLAGLKLVADVPDRTEKANGINVPAGGKTITYPVPFLAPAVVGITAHGMNSGDTYNITNNTAAGFTIRFYNSTGAGVARTFDFAAVSYGEGQPMAVTNDFYIDNQPGAPFRAELNTILAALAIANAGSTEPPNPQPGIMWLDTSQSPWVLKRRNSANTGWIEHYDTSNKPTKADVGLNHVDNFASTASLTDGSDSKFARAKATKALEDKKLDKSAVAADSAKLGGKLANSYAQQTGDYSGLRARATTKADVDLGNVSNYTASVSVTLNSNTSYALSSAVFSFNNTKLDKTAQAADSAKLLSLYHKY